jgi:hypothetical protein
MLPARAGVCFVGFSCLLDLLLFACGLLALGSLFFLVISVTWQALSASQHCMGLTGHVPELAPHHEAT